MLPLSLSLLDYDLENLWRQLVLAQRIDKWSPKTLQQRLVKTGGYQAKDAGTPGSCWRKASEPAPTRGQTGADCTGPSVGEIKKRLGGRVGTGKGSCQRRERRCVYNRAPKRAMLVVSVQIARAPRTL